MKEHFKRLLEYDLWANKQLENAITKNRYTNLKINILFSHILNSQQIWYSRVNGNPMGDSPWDIIEQEDFEEIMNIVNKNWTEFLETFKVEKLREKITYKNSTGEEFKNTLEDILTHMLNHSTYHRAQIAMQIKQTGKTPPPTDFIIFARSK